MTIDEHGRKLLQHISPAQRIAFFSTIISGYMVHLYAFTNLIPNSDGLSRVFDPQQMTISGRWFLHFATMPNSFTQMPGAIGLLSLLFLGLAAALLVSVLSIRSRMVAGLTGILMAAFPSMGFTYLYMFTAGAYCIAIFLSVLSVWLALKGKGWLLAAALALALSMGIYQAYVTVAIGLSLLVVIRKVLSQSWGFTKTRNLGFSLVGYLAGGAVLYYVILLVFLKVKNLELLSYLGMDAANSGYPLAQLPYLIFTAYKQVIAFFFLPGSANSWTTLTMVILDLAAVLLALFLLVRRLQRRHLMKERWRIISVILLFALFPLAINFGQIISPYAAPTPLMKYSFVLVYVAVLMLADLNDRLHSNGCLVVLAAGWALCLSVFFLNTNNLLYTASSQAHRATESYLTRMITQVELCPGYEAGMDVAVIGTIPPEQLISNIPSYSRVDHYSVPLNHVLPLNKHIYYYLNDWMNLPIPMPSEEVMIDISNSRAFRDMPLYPAEGSVQVLDGRAVVKLQSEYTPKSDFELAYENRR